MIQCHLQFVPGWPHRRHPLVVHSPRICGSFPRRDRKEALLCLPARTRNFNGNEPLVPSAPVLLGNANLPIGSGPNALVGRPEARHGDGRPACWIGEPDLETELVPRFPD